MVQRHPPSHRTPRRPPAEIRCGVTCVPTNRAYIEKGVPETNIKSIARGAAFLGSLLLLYTIASGLGLGSATEAVDASALQQHMVVGIVGTVLTIASIAILLRMKS